MATGRIAIASRLKWFCNVEKAIEPAVKIIAGRMGR